MTLSPKKISQLDILGASGISLDDYIELLDASAGGNVRVTVRDLLSWAAKGVGVYVDGTLVTSQSELLELVGNDFVVNVNSDGSVNIGLKNALRNNASDVLFNGFVAQSAAPVTKSSGTFTPDPRTDHFRPITNGGAHTLAPPSTPGGNAVSMVLAYTNNASAGAITTSGFTAVDGSFDTTNGHRFLCFITVAGGFSYLNIKALS